MIKETYVSFEVAKLLKEKGFGIEEETRGYYPIKGDAGGRLMFGAEYHHNTSQVQISAPTQQMAMAWLREVHHLFIWISFKYPNSGLPFYYEIRSLTDGKVKKIGDIEAGSYETICDEAIRYCLVNLL